MSRSLRSMLPALVLVVLVAASCTGQRQVEVYSDQYEKNFMFGCHTQQSIPEDSAGGPQSSDDYCKCVYKGLEEKVPESQVKEFEEQQAEQDPGEIKVPKPIQSVFDSCDKER